jgi:hypothetical protein
LIIVKKKLIFWSIILGSNFKDDIITMGNYKIPVLINKNNICIGNCGLYKFIREYMKNVL